jgi:HK97 family phage portal protein
MGFISRVRNAGRAFTANLDVSDERAWFPRLFGSGSHTSSGEDVNEFNADLLSAYFAAKRVISEDIAKTPCIVMQLQEDNNIEVPLPQHPVSQLMNRAPNPNITPIVYRAMETDHALGWGGGISEIIFDKRGKVPKELIPIHPSRVKIVENESGAPVYMIRQNSGKSIPFNQRDILHIRGMGDSLKGYSIAQIAREGIGLGKAAETFGGAVFANSMFLGTVFSQKQRMSKSQVREFRSQMGELFQGASKAIGYAVLGGDMSVHQLDLPNLDKAQILGMRGYQVVEMARWFRVSPNKIGHFDKINYNSLTELNHSHVDDTLMPWMIRWEQELARKLLTSEERDSGIIIRHDVRALRRGDLDSQREVVKDMRTLGLWSTDECRKVMGSNPIGGEEGKVLLVPRNMMTLDEAMKPPSLDNDDDSSDGNNRGITNVRDVHRDVHVDDSGSFGEDAVAPTIVTDYVRRVQKKETRAIERATERYSNLDAFKSYVYKFYGDHKEFCIESMSPITTLSPFLGINNSIIEDYCNRMPDTLSSQFECKGIIEALGIEQEVFLTAVLGCLEPKG